MISTSVIHGLVNYLQGDPNDDTPVSMQVPQETVIALEIREASGEISASDVMIKWPIGYFEEGGHFLYAALTAIGQ